MNQSLNDPMDQSAKPQLIRCVEGDCSQLFTFTVSEQQHYAEQRWQTPSRCRKCRERNREKRRNRPRSRD